MKFLRGWFEIELAMEIPRIEETNRSVASEAIRLRKACGRACIYYAKIACVLPRLQFQICRTCPRAAQYIRKNVVRSIFEYIKSLAILLMKNMGGQVSGAQASGSGGRGGSGGAAAGGGGA